MKPIHPRRPLLVKAFVIVPAFGLTTEWAYSAHVRSSPVAFAIASVIVAVVAVGVLRARMGAWVFFVAIFLGHLAGLIHTRHPVHRPLAVGIALYTLCFVLLFSPAMLRWVGVLDWLSRRPRVR